MAVSLNGDGTITGLSTLDSVTITGLTSLTTTDLTADSTTLVVDSANNRVGIGTASPSQELEVVGEVLANNFRLPDAGGTISGSRTVTGAAFQLFDTAQNIRAYTGGTERMRITSTGNVGIGTSSPNAKLHIHGGDQTTANIDTSSASNIVLNVAGTSGAAGSGGAMVFSANDGAWRFAAIKGLAVDGTSNTIGDLAFSVRNATTDSTLSEAMRIKYNGNVGIGTSSPDTELQVIGDITVGIADNTSKRLIFQGGGGTGYSGGIGWQRDAAIDNSITVDETESLSINFAQSDLSGRSLLFKSGSAQTERMRIDSSGNVGIGTSSPSSLGKLVVVGGNIVANGGGISDPEFRLNGAAGGVTRNYAFGTDGSQRLYWYDYTASAYRMVINSSGNVGIGTSSPSEKLEVTGNLILDATDSNIKIKSGSGGTTGAVNWTFSSDSTVYGSVSLPYDTRSTTGLLIQTTVNGYPITINSGNGVIFQEDGSEKMRIDSAGNVGIGTSSPLGKLKVAVGNNAPAASGNMNTGVVIESASGSRALNIGVNNTAGYSWINSAFANNSGVPDNLVLMTGAVERMRLDSNGNLQFNSGYGSVATAYGCRAWVNFNGTGTVAIRASGNVSSITDRGTGRYTMNIATAMPDANYSIVNTGSNNPGNTNFGHAAMIDGEAGTPLTTTYTYIAYKSDTASYVDVVYGCVAIFR